MLYSFHERLDPRTNLGAFTEVYESLGDAGQAHCDARLEFLRSQPPCMWVEPDAKKLSWTQQTACKGIYEIRFKANNVQQRPMGYFDAAGRRFVIVVWVTHKGNQYDPKNYCQIAQRRWQSIRDGLESTSAIEVD